MTDITLPEGYSPGLEGVIASLSAISKVDPQGDELIYYGYKVSQLCEQSNFEEVSYLLLYAALPTAEKLADFKRKLIAERNVDKKILDTLCTMPENAHYMDILRSGVSLMAHFDPQCEDNSREAEIAKSIRLIAKMPTLLAARIRTLKGEKSVAPNSKLGHAANFLYMVDGKEPDPDFSKALDTSLICYAEHGLNASTFAARVAASTLADMHGCITGAVATLKGPLHGGANEHAMHMLIDIGEASRAQSYIKEKLAQKAKIMGFGHRVYKKKDSRAPILKELSWKMGKKLNNTKWNEISDVVEKTMMDEKKLFPNVDFPAAALYYLLGFPIEVDTPLFVVARMSGWCAHVMEQRIGNRILRPESFYTGPEPRDYVPIASRGA
ncbi:MAG: citrate/2-methylcitrate synthase [Deltaproteobacteria bacterium]|nr:citrate/2-methylcitrate synthase [Deltaproteobacteria bacterium]